MLTEKEIINTVETIRKTTPILSLINDAFLNENCKKIKLTPDGTDKFSKEMDLVSNYTDKTKISFFSRIKRNFFDVVEPLGWGDDFGYGKNKENIYIQYASNDKTHVILTDKRKYLNNLVYLKNKKSNNEIYIHIVEKLNTHIIDAINIRSHQTNLYFPNSTGGCGSVGKIIKRTSDNQNKTGEKHPDCIQIVPYNQFGGGALDTIRIIGNNDNEISTVGDEKLQGILSSDGRIYNLLVAHMDITTQYQNTIYISGLMSGSFYNINLAANKRIVLMPLRLGGKPKKGNYKLIFIESMIDKNKKVIPYSQIFQRNIKRQGANYSVEDYREISNEETRKLFFNQLGIKDSKTITIYRKFPVDDFYQRVINKGKLSADDVRKTLNRSLINTYKKDWGMSEANY